MDFLVSITAALLLALHLVSVNVSMAGPLACIALEMRSRRQTGSACGQLGRWLAWVGCFSLIAGMGFGLLLAALMWWRGDSELFHALRRIPAGRLYWGVVELAFYLVCMVPYAAMWGRLPKLRWLHRAVAIAAATNLMYHFPPLFAVLGVLQTRGSSVAEALDKAAYRQLLMDGEVLAHVAHHLLAAVAAVGVVLMLRGHQAMRMAAEHGSAEQAEDLRRVVRQAAVLALGATLMQIPVGVWVLMETRAAERDALLGDQWSSTALFMTAILAALALLHSLSVVALGDVGHGARGMGHGGAGMEHGAWGMGHGARGTGRRQVLVAAALFLLVVVLMSGVLQQTRRLTGQGDADRSAATGLPILKIGGADESGASTLDRLR